MKKLLDLLEEEKYQKCNVKIGSKQGSSFWYCGKAKLTYSLPCINKEKQKLIDQSTSNLKQLQYRLKHLDKIYQDNINAAKKNGVKDFEKYERKMLRKLESERKSLPRKIMNVQYDIDTDLLDRPVQEIVKGICLDEQPCYIIYVKGNEKGAYWTIEEYLNKDKKGKRHEEVY